MAKEGRSCAFSAAQDYVKARELVREGCRRRQWTPCLTSACFTTTVRVWRRTTSRPASGTKGYRHGQRGCDVQPRRALRQRPGCGARLRQEPQAPDFGAPREVEGRRLGKSAIWPSRRRTLAPLSFIAISKANVHASVEVLNLVDSLATREVVFGDITVHQGFIENAI